MIKISIALWHWQVALLLFVVCEEGPAPHKYWINDESGLKGVKMRSQYFLKMVAYIKRIHNFPVIIPYPPKSLPWEEIRVVVIEIWIWRSVLILSLTSVVLEAVQGGGQGVIRRTSLRLASHPIPASARLISFILFTIQGAICNNQIQSLVFIPFLMAWLSPIKKLQDN